MRNFIVFSNKKKKSKILKNSISIFETRFKSKQMQDITDLQQRGMVSDARDSGGRIGPAGNEPKKILNFEN